jgi:dipeptidyl-peptidase-4
MFGLHFRRFVPALSVLLATCSVSRADEGLTLEKIFGPKPILPPLPAATWVGDSRGVCLVRAIASEGGRERSAFVIREVPSGKERVLAYLDEIPVPDDLRAAGEEKFDIDHPEWDRTGARAAFVFRGDVFFIDRAGAVERVTDTDGEEQDPTFSMDGKWLAYTRGHDLYTRDLELGVEVRHTATGSDTLYNGVLNWVYMEELFTRGEVKAYWWSPAGSRIAFFEIRDGMVPEYAIVDQVEIPATWRLQRYPRPGDPNPRVRLGIIDAASQAVHWTDVETGPDSYLVGAHWLADGSAIAIEKMNRAQDHLTLLFTDAQTGKSEVVLEEKSNTWINTSYARHFYEKRRQFLWGSEKDGHAHLYLHNLDGSSIRQATQGDWEVVDLKGVDEKKKRIYFTANEGSLLEQHLYRIDEDGGNLKRITTEEGTHDAVMSPDRKYFLGKYSSHARPTRYAVFNADSGKRLFDLGDQAAGEFAALRFPAPEFGTFEHDGRTFHYRLVRPLDFDPTKKYPVVVFVYGGPNSQVVKKMWSRQDLYHAWLADRGYIVFSMDNRGSSGRGRAWEEPLLRRMGQVELDDQVAGVEYLKKLSFVDPGNIGIWGWSYGGYMTLEAMFGRGDVFKAGVAVAPVSDWRLYDSIYTERYLKLPADNRDGYDASAPLARADSLQGALLIMHGDADDNVHVQNTIAVVRRLINAGKDFDLMLYPQKEHGIAGSADRYFLYRKMTAFFDRHLKPAAPPAPVPQP